MTQTVVQIPCTMHIDTMCIYRTVYLIDKPNIDRFEGLDIHSH
jgi:hypothetical protein